MLRSCCKFLTRRVQLWVQITRISVDAPNNFFNAHRVAKHYPRPKPVMYNGVDEAAYVLPAGQSILAATLKSRDMSAGRKKNYQIYADGKRVSRKEWQKKERPIVLCLPFDGFVDWKRC